MGSPADDPAFVYTVMRIVLRALAVIVVLVVVVVGLQIVASETGEVVVLHTRDAAGAETATRLWVVDHDGFMWLRAGGGAESGWYRRLTGQPLVALERDGVRRKYLAAVEPVMSGTVNELMQEKYGWRDDVVAAFAGSRANGVAIRLTPSE